MSCYDEFALLRETAADAGLRLDLEPLVARTSVEVEPGRALSALSWGAAEPEVVFLHGGAQNAHTWDVVALALGLPALAIDLPGHGHSDRRPDLAYGPWPAAEDVAVAMRALAPRARAVVGMSLGGMTGIVLAARHPELIERLALVDITPGVGPERAGPLAYFFAAPSTFDTFDDALRLMVALSPKRSESSLRRGLLHNLARLQDGSWTWRHDPRLLGEAGEFPDLSPLWDDLSRGRSPLLLVRGGTSKVVLDDDVAELLRRRQDARVEVVEGAGHSVQGDRPLELARALASFLDSETGVQRARTPG